jgi:uncharacterized membrane protein
MIYLFFKFLHVGSMFLATALAVGPIVVLVLILRTGDVATIRRTFRFAEPLSRAGGIFYGLGVIFGIGTALNGAIDLTAGWLLIAYGLLVLLVATNLYADRWMRQVNVAAQAVSGAESSPELDGWRRSQAPIWSLASAIAITLALVFVMVVKPTLS